MALLWFKYPPGSTGITVQQIEFGQDYKDRDGNLYFQAPEHFEGIILAIGGFERVEAPEGAPDKPTEAAELAEKAAEAALSPKPPEAEPKPDAHAGAGTAHPTTTHPSASASTSDSPGTKK